MKLLKYLKMKVFHTMPLKNKALNIFTVLLLLCANSFAQEQTVIIDGIVKSDTQALQDINIVNKTRKLGTSSNINGGFSIPVSLGDSIQFSSINYNTRIIEISLNHIQKKEIIVFLEASLNELDEIAIEQKVRLDFGNMALPNGSIFEMDAIDLKAAPNARNLTDPTSPAGSNNGNLLGVVTLLTDKIFEKSRERKKLEKILLQDQETFSSHIVESYGKDFFIHGLNIHEDDLYLFIDFCIDNGLNNYNTENEFTTKNFLVVQSKQFLALKSQ